MSSFICRSSGPCRRVASMKVFSCTLSAALTTREYRKAPAATITTASAIVIVKANFDASDGPESESSEGFLVRAMSHRPVHVAGDQEPSRNHDEEQAPEPGDDVVEEDAVTSRD